MPVYKDKERGTYYYAKKITLADGTTKQLKGRGFKKKQDAILAEADALLNFEPSSSITFNELANKYHDWYRKRRKESSIKVIRNVVFNHLIPEFGDAKANKITPNSVINYQDKIMDKYSAEFLKKIHTVLSAIFNFGIKFHGLTDNPARTAGNFEMESNKRMNFWEFDEFKQFIGFVDEILYKTFFSALYYSGARKGELLALTWADIDFENKSIDINKTDYNRIITKPKTKASNRIVLLPKNVMELFAELKKDAEKTAPVKNKYVVFGEFLDSISTSTLDRKYDQYIKLSGVNRILLHEFRHSHASYLINKGVSPLIVAQRLGHSDVATTLNTYSHLYPSKQTEVVTLMENDL